MVVKGYYILSLLSLSCIPTTTNQMSIFELRATMIERMWVPAKAIQTSKSIPDVPRVPAQNSHLTDLGRTAVNLAINQSSSRYQARQTEVLRARERRLAVWLQYTSCSLRPGCYRAITPPPGNEVSRAGVAARRVQSHATCPAFQNKSVLVSKHQTIFPFPLRTTMSLCCANAGKLLFEARGQE